MSTRFRVRLDGEITIRRLCPPQRQTTAAIRGGALTEPIAAVAARVGVDLFGAEPAGLVDAQGLALHGRLAPGAEVFLSGTPSADGPAGPIRSNGPTTDGPTTDGPTTDGPSVRLPPDAAVAFAYDERMLSHVPFAAPSPEVPQRLSRAIDALRAAPRSGELLPPAERESGVNEAGRGDKDSEEHPNKSDGRTMEAVWIPPRMAELSEIARCHSVSRYEAFVTRGVALAPPLKSDVYCSGDGSSSDAAKLAAGAVLDAAYAALRLAPPIAFCLVRPPGHHCSRDEPGGFCLINNVAVAAYQILADAHAERLASADEDTEPTAPHDVTKGESATSEAKKKKCERAHMPSPRIAIVDLDVHHGEGTQSLVEPDPRLLFLSLHRYDGGSFYPRDPRGATSCVGPHRNVCNVAVNTAATDPARCEEVISDLLFERVLSEIFIPRLHQFRPHIVLVSFGFDAAYGDPLGRMAVEGGFAYAARALKAFCRELGIGLVVALEGGYAPEAVARGVVAVAHALRLPHNDADVVAFAARRVPKTWHDMRRKLARKRREAAQIAEECEEREAGGNGEEKGKGMECEELPEDDVLVKRHEQWCDRLIARVLAIHAEANHIK